MWLIVWRVFGSVADGTSMSHPRCDVCGALKKTARAVRYMRPCYHHGRQGRVCAKCRRRPTAQDGALGAGDDPLQQLATAAVAVDEAEVAVEEVVKAPPVNVNVRRDPTPSNDEERQLIHLVDRSLASSEQSGVLVLQSPDGGRKRHFVEVGTSERSSDVASDRVVRRRSATLRTVLNIVSGGTVRLSSLFSRGGEVGTVGGEVRSALATSPVRRPQDHPEAALAHH